MGPIIQVFHVITENQMQVEQLEINTLLFPPIITGLFAAVRAGMWRVIGKKAIENFIYPNFVSAYFDEKTGKARAWFLCDGEKNTPLGAQLPSEYKKLEYLMVWNPPYVVRRIETGE